MTNSEIIAIVAIVVSGITSVATLIATFYTNRTNNQFKRYELAFERRIEAFRGIFETMNNCNGMIEEYNIYYNVIGLENMFEDGDSYIQGEEKMRKTVSKIKFGFLDVYYKNRIYIPPHIDNRIQRYVKEVLIDTGDLISTPTEETIAHRLEKAMITKDTLTENIVSEMHKFIGFK